MTFVLSLNLTLVLAWLLKLLTLETFFKNIVFTFTGHYSLLHHFPSIAISLKSKQARLKVEP